MFQQITLLCLGVVLNAANKYDLSPSLEAYNGTLLDLPNQDLEFSELIQHGKPVQSSHLQLYGHGRIHKKLGNHRKALVYPRKGSDLNKQETTGNNMSKRTSLSRGLITGLWNGTVGTLLNMLGVTRKVVRWMAGTTIRIGKVLIGTPIQGVELTINAAWAAHTLGVGLTSQILSDTAEWFEGNWEAVKTVEFPGKNLIIMLYPSGLFSVVNKLTKEIIYIMDRAHKMLTHAFAFTLYFSMKVVFDALNTVIKVSRLNCIKPKSRKMEIHEKMMETMSFKGGKICGIAHLKPKNNIIITRNDRKFLIVETPWVLENLSIHLTGLTVIGEGVLGTLIDNEVLNIKVERVKATGTVKFEAGTLLRFARLSLKVDSIEGVKAKFRSKRKNGFMEGIEDMADDFTFLVEQEVNKLFHRLEVSVFDYIANM